MGELGIDQSLLGSELQGLLHGRDEALSVVLQRARVADRVPQLRLLGRFGLEPDRLAQEGDALIDLVAAYRQLRRPT